MDRALLALEKRVHDMDAGMTVGGLWNGWCVRAAGTVVDKGIVHPKEYDFYLNAHASIQGTSRPVHYHVLLDQNNLGPDQLQSFTYEYAPTQIPALRAMPFEHFTCALS